MSDPQRLLAPLPDGLRNALVREIQELDDRFLRRDWGPAELNGGRFAEVLLRYLEWKQRGSFTPLGTSLNRLAIVNAVENDPSLSEGLRFHVRRCAELLMDVRNKRDVAHLGKDVTVNEMDAHLVLRLASWSLAEIIREEGAVSPAVAQQAIDRLSATHVPIVENVGGQTVVVGTHLTAAERALVALYHGYPDPMGLEELRTAVGYQNRTRFPTTLARYERTLLIHRRGGDVYLTRKGVAWIETNIDLRIDLAR